MQVNVEVCIVSFNSAHVLSIALDRIAEHIPEASVAVREHGSDRLALDRLQELATTFPLPIRVDFDVSNPGFAAGCNALAAESTAPWLLFLNPDAEVLAWPWSVDQPPLSDTVVGPLMVGKGESARQSGTSYSVLDEVRRSWLRRSGPPPTGQGFVSGAALLIDRSSFERVGGFDDGYFMYYEDIDFCLRANAYGVGTVIAPSWRVRHDGAHATRTRLGDSLIWSYRSACRFHARRGSNLFRYRLYVIADSILRSAYHQFRMNPEARRAYLNLARTAAGDAAPSRPES